MCGIYAYLYKNTFEEKWEEKEECYKRMDLLEPRGPERRNYMIYKNIFLGFRRLSIVDTSTNGDQPFTDSEKRASLICNGEIYNAKELQKKYNLQVTSKSDCEVILYMYLQFGIEKTLEELDGVFAFILYDYKENELIACRDSFGVRPLFYSITDKGIAFSSEIKSLYNYKNVKTFPIGSYWTSILPKHFSTFYYKNTCTKMSYKTDGSFFLSPLYKSHKSNIDMIHQNIQYYLEKSITKRLQSDRKIGCLLSGGLDSSLVTALVHKHSKENIVTYSVGLEGSVDLAYARKVASYLGTEHHEIIFSERKGLESIKNVIYATETWDTTTIRASIPMWLMCKYIKENTPEVKVILSGEGADEVCQGYLYFHKQPNIREGHKESVRLLQDLLYFDVLRSDRSVASHGLEVRVPFLDKDFVNYYMCIPAKLRCPKNKIEKWLLRETFSRSKLLPDEILWRKKDGLSDGCSSFSRPWYQVIQEYAEKEISDTELQNASTKYSHCPPKTKESLLFRNIFSSMFPNRDTIIPYQWMPKWCGDMTDPSGRLVE